MLNNAFPKAPRIPNRAPFKSTRRPNRASGGRTPEPHEASASCERRKRRDSTLTVCMGEFGRTPRITRTAGRDHWPYSFSVALAGGGIKPGVVGATSPDGTRVVKRPVSVPDVFATVLTAMGIDPQAQRMAGERPLRLADNGKPIRELLG